MQRIYKEIYLGSENDFYMNKDSFEYVMHACKEPFHRNLLGYTGKSAPKDHPEYLVAYRDRELYLNLVDARTKDYIPINIIEKAIRYLQIHEDNKVLVHCNLGESRSPSIVFLFLYLKTPYFTGKSFKEALKSFKDLYSPFNPSQGMLEVLQQYGSTYPAASLRSKRE